MSLFISELEIYKWLYVAALYLYYYKYDYDNQECLHYQRHPGYSI